MSVAALALWAGAGFAEAPATSQRPAARPMVATVAPDAAQVPASVPVATAQGAGKRPLPRPAAVPPAAASVPAAAPVVGVVAATSARPMPRPAGLAPAAATATAPASPTVFVVRVAAAGPDAPRPRPRPDAAAEPPAVIAASAPAPAPERRGGLLGGLFGGSERKRDPSPKSGYVCGDPDIRGEELARITSKVRGCGIDEPVRVVAVDGVRLSTPATIDCTTAGALKTWVQQGLRPAFKSREIVQIQIAASYICRPRNNIRGNKISEHGRGKAVDVSGIIFADGKQITVAQNYGRELRRAHKAACGIFGTTLGPGSDGYHEDHLHFDTAAHRNGPYCR